MNCSCFQLSFAEVVFFNVRKVYSQNKNILTGFVTTSFILMLITWLLIMFETGRLVYPVNGLPVVTGDNLRTTLAEIYAAWHLCDILLGLFIIFWSGLLSHSFWKYSGITIGLLQMICTYFGQGKKPIPLFIAIILSTIWLLKQSISIVNELREKKLWQKICKNFIWKIHTAETVGTYCKETGSGMKVVFDVFKGEDFAIYSGILS